MKIAKSLAIATVLVIGGLNVSAQIMNPVQTARTETTELKMYITGITPDEEGQMLTVEQDYARGMQNAKNTITDDEAMKTQKDQLWDSKHVKIKAILTADQFKQYRKVERTEKHYVHHNSNWLDIYYISD